MKQDKCLFRDHRILFMKPHDGKIVVIKMILFVGVCFLQVNYSTLQDHMIFHSS